MRKAVLAGCLGGALLALSGCATQGQDEPLMPEPIFPELKRDMDVGVNYIEPTSDIVIMDPSYQHVVLPNGATVAYRPGWEDEALAAVAENLKELSKTDETVITQRDRIGPSSADVKEDEIPALSLADLPTAEESDDPVYRAWRKLCDMKPEDLTDNELQTVLHVSIPEELKKFCAEGQRWLRELK